MTDNGKSGIVAVSDGKRYWFPIIKEEWLDRLDWIDAAVKAAINRGDFSKLFMFQMLSLYIIGNDLAKQLDQKGVEFEFFENGDLADSWHPEDRVFRDLS